MEVVPSPIVHVEELVPIVFVELDAPDDAPFPFRVRVFIASVVGTFVVMLRVAFTMFVVLSAKKINSLAASETYCVLDAQFEAVVQSLVPVVMSVQVNVAAFACDIANNRLEASIKNAFSFLCGFV